MNKGRFITLEGGEGVGKSTLAKALAHKIQTYGKNVVLTREPGGSPGAEAIRSLVLTPPAGTEWSSLSQAMLFFAARADHLKTVILPSLQKGAWVICDRFTDSTRAYQAAGSGLENQTIDVLDQIAVGDSQPDLTFILDLEYEVALQRRLQRGEETDFFEKKSEQFHDRVRRAFLQIAADFPERCVVLDASVDNEQLEDTAFKEIKARFL